MTQNERVKRFKELYSEIDDEFLLWLQDNKYFEALASRGHHGSYAGGLFDHSYAVAVQLLQMTKDNCLNWQRSNSPVIIGLFHDICKIDQFRRDMLLKGHGEKSIMILASHIQLTEEEVMCIRYHMGAFTEESEWEYYTRAVKKYPNVLWTHHADMIASQVMGV